LKREGKGEGGIKGGIGKRIRKEAGGEGEKQVCSSSKQDGKEESGKKVRNV